MNAKPLGRPPKDKRLKMDVPLRIMLTADQRQAVEQAAVASGQEMSAWARGIILKEAGKALVKMGARGD